MERMISRCFTWVPIGDLGEPNIYHDSGVFYKNWVFYLEGSEYEFIIEELTNKPSTLTACFTSP